LSFQAWDCLGLNSPALVCLGVQYIVLPGTILYARNGLLLRGTSGMTKTLWGGLDCLILFRTIYGTALPTVYIGLREASWFSIGQLGTTNGTEWDRMGMDCWILNGLLWDYTELDYLTGIRNEGVTICCRCFSIFPISPPSSKIGKATT
jgi:hypothetical protein